MKVGCVSIKGFKSIQDTVELHLRDTLTCLIGANEHGKSNILLAIQKIGEQKLNIADKNTVMANDGKEDIPTIMFELRLEEQDKPKILDKLTPLANTSKTAISTTGPENTVPQPEDEKSKLLKEFLLTFEEKNEVILKLTINITGRSYSYDKWINLGQYLPELIDVLEQLLPKSYLFAPSNQIVDSISLDELNTRHSIEFEGLLKLANFWERKEILFENGANAAGMRIKASRLLRSKVKKLWYLVIQRLKKTS